MGISIREFEVAMETFKATRLPNRTGSRYNISVPCFKVGDVAFIHSGSYYIVQRDNKVSEEIMNQAMAEFGEKNPGGDNFWWGEIHSVKGILTLAAMLEGRYSKELINQLANETYQILFNCSSIQSNERNRLHSPKMEELQKLLIEYDNIVNPFGNCNFKMKKPIEYFDTIKVSFSGYEEIHFKLENEDSSIKVDIKSQEWFYKTTGLNNQEKGQDGGYTCMIHYFDYCQENKMFDEIIYLDYTIGNGIDDRIYDIDLRISMKTGLAWKTYKEDKATLATDEQIEIMMTHLKFCIERAKKTIIDFMVDYN